MGKILAGLVAGFALLLMLVIILTLAASVLASSMANLAMSSALLTSQCVIGFVVVLAVISTALTVWNFAILAQRRNPVPQMPRPVVFPAMKSPATPYPPAQLQLPAGQRQLPTIYVAGQQIEDEENVDDVLFANWGW